MLQELYSYGIFGGLHHTEWHYRNPQMLEVTCGKGCPTVDHQ